MIKLIKRQSYHHINQLTDFYMMATLAFNELSRTCSTSSVFKWWESYSNCISWEEKTYSSTCAKTWMNRSSFCCTYICILEGKKLELTFSNFLTIKKLEWDFTNLFNHDKNNQHWIVYWSLGRRKVLMVCQLCNLWKSLWKSDGLS